MKTYIIKNTLNGLFKIGRSSNIKNRLITINSILGGVCDLILTINHDCESMLHCNYSNQNVFGEWFILSENDICDIADYSFGENLLSNKIMFMNAQLEVLKTNNFVRLNLINSLMDMELMPIANHTQTLNNQSEFIKTLIPKYGCVISRNGSGAIWCHILLFLEIARQLNAKIKLEVYETLIGNSNIELQQIVRLAVDEAKKVQK